MKKITFTLLSTLISLLSIGQISGGFLNGTDYSGNMFVYFKGTNISQNSVQIKIKCINEQLDQEKSWDCKISIGGYFTVGPSDNWIWQSGEKLIITYSDETSYYWIYVPLQNYNTFINRDIMTPSWMDNIPDINKPKSNRSIDEIDIQISKIERNLEDTRRIYENCSSVVLKPSYYRVIQDYEKMLQELKTERIYAK